MGIPMKLESMTMRTTTYSLEVHQLHRPYRAADSVQNATRVHEYESVTPFGEFHIGETFSDSSPTKYLGRIQHIHHWLGEGDGKSLMHRTILYVFNEG
jgi:hypothetical protein